MSEVLCAKGGKPLPEAERIAYLVDRGRRAEEGRIPVDPICYGCAEALWNSRLAVLGQVVREAIA